MKRTKKLVALLMAIAMVSSTAPFSNLALADEAAPAEAAEKATPEDGYIAAPYTAADAKELTAQFFDPVYYENEDGPTIGVTLLGVVVKDGKYFRDLNNNQELDDFEDWRLPAEERAASYAKSLTDEQLSYQLLNNMRYNSNGTTVASVVGEDGKPDWYKMYSGGSDGDPTTIIKYWEEAGFRNFVVRNNAAPEVGVWFNNGLEQYAEYDAVIHGTTAVPFLSFTNPIGHGMPGTEGVTAAVLGDGNADLVLKDAQLDRVMMWTKGIDGIYGPQIDLVTDPRWSRNSGTYGEREDTAAEIARALTIGFQNGDQGMVPGSVLLTVKHFPGDGAAYNGFESHGYTGRYRVYSTENSLADYQLKPFIAAFEAGAAGVMPGYSQPIIDERIAPQSITYNGQTYDIKLEGYGNAFNESVLQYLLREVLGFEGLINSDSVSQSNAHGVEEMSGYDQTVLFVNAGCQSGVFSAAGKMGGMSISPELIYEALQNGDITRETLEAAAAGRAKPRMQSGDMENPYRDLETSVKEYNAAKEEAAKLAKETHLKSVVLMKNSEEALPLVDTSKKIYLQAFNQRGNANVNGITESLKKFGCKIVDDYKEADVAFLIVSPTIVGQGSGNLAVLDLVEDVETPVFDKNAKPTGETANITTVSDMGDFQKIANAVHENGGKVIGQIEASNAWILTNMEPYCDALIGTFNTSTDAVAKVVTGRYNPTGKLPITMVADASVIALVTTELGEETWEVCVSPNDVPGYVKDQYMDPEVLAASPSGSYAYKDAAGNLYFSGFGLSYEGMEPGAQIPADGYIPAPYTANDATELTAQFLDPVYYYNEDGPTIGVTLLGVVVKDGKYFRDLNNNQELDDFEDWRLPAEERAASYAKTLTDEQLSYQLPNLMRYNSNSTKVEDVVDESGKPVWYKMYSGGSDDDPTTIVKYWEENGFRNFVVRNNAAPEVGVWFNNGLEQYAEYDAVQHGTTAVPFLSFTNPIGHGMPGTEGVTAAVLGDGNANLVLKDAQLDRIMMWTKGIDGIYGPQIDLVTDPRWSRNAGTYGEREDTAAEIARALTIGFQNGDQGMVPGSVLLTVKHFPGDGSAYNGFESHGHTGRYRIYSTENSLADYQLKPFIAAFEAGAAGVMPGYSQPIIDARIASQSITYNGQTYDIRLEGYGNAFNEDILQYLLREVLGFEGLINSDSLGKSSAHGVEELSGYEQTVLYVNAGCEAGVFTAAGEIRTAELILQALQNGDITRETLEAAAAGRAKPRMLSGDMENPYRDLDTSVKEYNAAKEEATKLAEQTHLKSVVLMKNSEATLPLTDMGKKVYLQAFNQRGNANVNGITESLKAQGYTIVEDYKEADVAYLIVTPTIVGQGSHNLAVLDLVEDVETPVFDDNAKPTGETANITTVSGMADFQKIADAIHEKGGKVIGQIEATNAWILTNMEPYCDALIGTFNTSTDAVAQVVAGKYNPTGKLPITMVADASVIALVTTELGEETWEVCVSPNDVPGYVKDQYMAPEVLAASPSGSYAYKDADGNFYFSGFGLSYPAPEAAE